MPPDELDAPPQTQYEYTIVQFPLPADDNEVIALLNEYGLEGWQLVFPTIVNAGRLWLMREVK